MGHRPPGPGGLIVMNARGVAGPVKGVQKRNRLRSLSSRESDMNLLSTIMVLTLGIAAAQGEMVPVAGESGVVTRGERVLSCGNSFHTYVPAMLAEMAAAAGISGHEVSGTSMIGAAKIAKHWDVKEEENKAKTLLREGKVDVLTLSGVYLPDEGIEKFTRLGLEANPNLRVTLQEFWIPFDEYNLQFYVAPRQPWPKVVDHNAATGENLRKLHQPYFAEMDAAVSALNQEIGRPVVVVVPVGQAVIALREKIIAGQAPGLKLQADLFKDPLGHPKPPLQVLVSYCHFAVIYRKSPVGLPVPEMLARTKMDSNERTALNLLMQQLAWEAVQSHPLSGVKPEAGSPSL